MAATPLFQSLEKLKQSLRVSSISTGADVSVQLDRAVENARLTFWRKVGAAATTTLAGLPKKDPPTTEDHYKRLLAEHTELLLVWSYLAMYLPVSVMDGSADFRQLWNSDEQFKNISDGGRQARINIVHTTIEENFELLSGEDSAANETSVGAITLEPQNIQPIQKFLGTSIYQRLVELSVI